MLICRSVLQSALVILLLASAALATAQEGAASSTPTSVPGQAATTTQPQTSDAGKDAKTAKPSDDRESQDFSESTANAVLNDIRDGLEGHNARHMLSAFERDKMDGYLSFEDRVQAFFQRYEGFRVRFHIIQTSMEGSRGVALAEFDVEATPRSGGSALRRGSQLRFELERGRKGWKIVDVTPRGFFS